MLSFGVLDVNDPKTNEQTTKQTTTNNNNSNRRRWVWVEGTLGIDLRILPNI